MNEITRLKMLEQPTGMVDAVLDTDTFNEVDDQFALSYMLKSGDRINVKAIYAAPFFNPKATSPKDGMEKSYEEIQRLLKLLGKEDMPVFKGSESYLPDEKTPVISPAAEHLAKLAMEYSPEKPLYVVAIGAITNVASAILLNPEIIDRIVLIWLGGEALEWPHNREFNLEQDVAAARVVFGCGAPLIQFPCMGVVSAFTISEAELRHYLLNKNPLCDFLVNRVLNEMAHREGKPWTRIICDVTAVSWLTGNFCSYRLIPSPIPEYDDLYAYNPTRHLIKYVYHIHRDELFTDLMEKLTDTKF